MNKYKVLRFFIPFIIVIVTFTISTYLVLKTDIENNSIFSSNSLITYFGILIGFALTIYTFGLSMISNIKTNISNLEDISEQDKKDSFQKLIVGFVQIKQDIWLIFYGIILVIILSILKEVVNPFGWQVEDLQIPEIFNISIFILSTIAMYDIMKTLFNLSEINMILIKSKKEDDETSG